MFFVDCFKGIMKFLMSFELCNFLLFILSYKECYYFSIVCISESLVNIWYEEVDSVEWYFKIVYRIIVVFIGNFIFQGNG